MVVTPCLAAHSLEPRPTADDADATAPIRAFEHVHLQLRRHRLMSLRGGASGAFPKQAAELQEKH